MVKQESVVKELIKILSSIGLEVYVIGARSLILYRVDLGRETRDWDLTIDKPYTVELRDKLTNLLRRSGYSVQWRKWGLLVEKGEAHIDINYAPLILDDEFKVRARIIGGYRVPSLEDLVVLKLMSGERKDMSDLKKILVQKWSSLDKQYLMSRVKQAGLEKEYMKLIKRLGLKT